MLPWITNRLKDVTYNETHVAHVFDEDDSLVGSYGSGAGCGSGFGNKNHHLHAMGFGYNHADGSFGNYSTHTNGYS